MIDNKERPQSLKSLESSIFPIKNWLEKILRPDKNVWRGWYQLEKKLSVRGIPVHETRKRSKKHSFFFPCYFTISHTLKYWCRYMLSFNGLFFFYMYVFHSLLKIDKYTRKKDFTMTRNNLIKKKISGISIEYNLRLCIFILWSSSVASSLAKGNLRSFESMSRSKTLA